MLHQPKVFRMRHRIQRFAKFATWPAEKISEVVGKVIPHDRKQGKVAAGVCLMIGASGMATSYPAGCPIPHALYDAFAYFMHAIGCAPVFEAYAANKKQRKQEELNKCRNC